MIVEILNRLVARENLSRAESATVMRALMTGEATPSQIGALLVALRMKGETVEEIAGFAETMRAFALPVRPKRSPLLDTCGTGGSRFRVFNVSTAAAFVLVAAGIAVAKHGNRAVTGVCGSADVLEALGICVNLTPERCAASIDEVGIGFLFAQSHHPSMRHVGPTRREIGVRSVFNLLGPLTNPAGATRQTLGVYEPRLCELAVGALRDLGTERAIVLHGEVGLDEISTIGPTRISELIDGEIVSYVLTRTDLGLLGQEPSASDLAPRPTPAENAQLLREVLAGIDGTEAQRARLDLVAVNAAASLRVTGISSNWVDAVDTAREILRSRRALEIVEQLATFTQTN